MRDRAMVAVVSFGRDKASSAILGNERSFEQRLRVAMEYVPGDELL